MTPSQLRERAWRNIQTAVGLLDSDPDNAANLAGQAAELALKARYCTRFGITNFPETKDEMKKAGLGRLATHQLNDLLTLCNGINLAQNAAIEWDKVSDWSVTQRYDPVGSIAKDVAEQRVKATEALCFQLSVYEFVEALIAARRILEDELRLSFTVFALHHGEDDQNLLLIAGPGISKHAENTLEERLLQLVDEDLFGLIDDGIVVASPDPLESSYRKLQAQLPGCFLLMYCDVFGTKVKSAYLLGGEPQPEGANVFFSQCTWQ